MATAVDNEKKIAKARREILQLSIIVKAIQKSQDVILASLEAAGIEIVTGEPVEPPVSDFPEPPASTENETPPADDYDETERDDLYALAVERELSPHVQLGKAKLIDLLREADASAVDSGE